VSGAGPGSRPAEDAAAGPWDVPTQPEIVAPRWPPPDDDPFVTLGLLDDLI
jgi:hypothetical protein